MGVRLLAIACSFFLIATKLSAQCPDRDSLWKRLIVLRDSAVQLSLDEKLKELLNYDARMKNCYYRGDSTQALLKQRIGATYFHKADFLNAARYMRQAASIITVNAASPSVNVRHNIRNYYSLAWIYDSLDNVAAKIEALDSCASIALLYRSADIFCVNSLSVVGEYLYDMGDYQRCIEYATINERVSGEYAGKSNGKTERLNGLKFSLWSSFLKVNALLMLHKFKEAEDVLISRIDECKKNELKAYLGTVYQQLAKVQLKKGNGKQALANYNDAFRYEKETGDSIACMAVLNQIGYEVYFKYFHDTDNALSYCRKSLRYANKKKPRDAAGKFILLNIFSNIGNIYSSKGFYDSALAYFQFAFDQIEPGMNELALLNSSFDEFSKNKSIHYLTELLINKGNTFVKQFKFSKKPVSLSQAIHIYKITDQLLGRIRSGQKELESKLSWRGDSKHLYENAIEACFLQNNSDDAFYFFEKSRAILLNDQLAEKRLMRQDEIMKQAQLKKTVVRLGRELDKTDNDPGHRSAIRDEIFIVKQELARLEQVIKTGNPLYYQSFLDTGFITLKYVQQELLKKDKTLLEIFSGDSIVYALQVTATNCYLNKINKYDFETTTNKYISYVSNADLMNRDFSSFVNTASHLYHMVFQQPPLPGQRVIVSPDAQYFPFESLVTSGADLPVKWFLNDHAVSYTYSARFLMNDFYHEPGATRNFFIGFAPVNYLPVFSLASLPGSDQSLYRIAGYFDYAKSLVNSNASRNNFMEEFSQYPVIQLYTHAADSSVNNEPVIYFADSALYLSDLINEGKPLTRLIVLSACETGTGKNYNGEGVFSFNRGFAALGIPAAITNLWSVDNGSTYKLTELFYKWLAKGFPTDVALQKAKLEFLQTASKEKSMPCYWAGPVLVGKTDTIEFGKSYPWKWIVFFAGMSCVAFWIVRKQRASVNK